MIPRFFLLFLFLNFLNLSANYTELPDRSTLQILSPTLRDQKTAKIELSNGLKAYLISNPNIEQSGAAMSVLAGSWMEPDEMPGLAHFIEHLLFLGTKEYPELASFDKYIKQHGGELNAFTSSDSTNFFFSIDNNAFKEGLSRFASMFKEPLFDPTGVSHELQAIDEEFSSRKEDDMIRLIQTLEELGNPKHPDSRFSFGNTQTLKKVTRNDVLEWYETHYSANQMRLIVISSSPLDQLKQLVSENFDGIKNRDLQFSIVKEPLFSSQTTHQIVYVVPIKDTNRLLLSWELPQDFYKDREDQPEEVICRLLKDQSFKSLLGNLKDRHLAEKLECGISEEGQRGFEFHIEITLTPEGVKEFDKIITMVFEELSAIKSEEVPKYLFDEIQQLAQNKYQYQVSNKTFVMLKGYVEKVSHANFETFPESEEVPQHYNPKAVTAMLDQLTPDKVRIALMAPISLTEVTPNKIETWFGVPYAVKPVPEDWLQRWKSGEKKFIFPLKNPFIPEKLEILKFATSLPISILPKPTLITSTDNATIYYCHDPLFQLPSISFQLLIKSPQIDQGIAAKNAMCDLYINCLKDNLNEISFQFKAAGLEYTCKQENDGVEIAVNGYSPKVSLLLEKIASMLAKVAPTEKQFALKKSELLRKYQNDLLDSPLEQAQTLLKSVLYKKYATPDALVTALKKVSYESFIEYTHGIFKKSFVEGILYGNLSEMEALAYSNKIIASLKSEPFPKSKHIKREVLIFPPNKGPFFFEIPSQVQGNATLLTIALGDYSFKKRGIQQILMDAIQEPFFTTLRTKQQTGYLTDSSPYQLEMQLFSVFAVQSNTYDPRDLLARFELFIESFLRQPLEVSIPQKAFENIKNAKISALQKPAKNMNEMAKLLFIITFIFEADFNLIQNRINALQELSYIDFIKESYNLLGRINRRRLAILIKGPENGVDPFNFVHLKNLNELRKVSTFQGR